MASLGLIAGYALQSYRAKKYELTPNDAADITFWAMLGGLVGARLLYVHRFWQEQFSGHFVDIFKVYEGGLVFYGGLCGAAVAVIILCLVKHKEIWRAAELLAPALPLGHAFGRIGCLLNGCCYGFEYHGFCSIKYAYPEWPTFPLEGVASLINVCICITILQLEKHGKLRKRLFLAYILLYCLCRFLLEFGRGDYPASQLRYGMTPAQVTCLWLAPAAAIVYAAAFFIGKHKRQSKHATKSR